MGSTLEERATTSVVIAASFTAEPIEPCLRFWLQLLELSLGVSFAPYHQVFQELLTPTSELARNATGINVVLFRLEDYLRGSQSNGVAGDSEPERLLLRTKAEFSQALAAFAQRSSAPLVLSLFGPSIRAPIELHDALRQLTRALTEEARALPGVTLLDPKDCEVYTPGPWDDPERDELGHIPYTETFFAAFAAALARKLHALKIPAHKVLVLDCDNTLWSGVVGEDGADGIGIPAGCRALQRFALEQQAQGTLICLCSKNADRDVLEVFERRQQEMLLRTDHIVAQRVNWLSKSENLHSLAQDLNLGLESFVFIDDNPIECGQVRAQLPQVTTLQLPPDGEVERFLRNLWAFERASVTEEDAKRTQMYRENRARDQFEQQSTGLEDFIAGLEVRIEIGEPEDGEWPRAAQLTQRTNQFNFTTIRRNEAEMRALAHQGTRCLRVRVGDRFGDYGLVGIVVFATVAAELKVDSLMLSCRALGRGVEHAMLRVLGEIARELRLQTVELPLRPTAKNEPARAFADSLVGAYRVEADGGVTYRIPTDVAAGITHRPGADPEVVIAASRSEGERKPSAAGPVTAGKSERYQRIACELLDAASLLEAARRAHTRARRLSSAPTPPANDVERQLLALWETLVGVQGLGVTDDYFELGGTSLLAVQLFAEIRARFGLRLPLTTIVEAPTIRALAKRLEGSAPAKEGVLVALRHGAPRSLFLVHDGDGETLLYMNLAARMPADMAVYGIAPRRLPGVPLAHTSIEEMARFYVGEIRRIQPHGPYHLGGLCAGGTIAFEMAAQLERAGESVALVAVLDAATPDAARRKGLTTARRWQSFVSLLGDATVVHGGWAGRAHSIARKASRKIRNLAGYELQRRAEVISVELRVRLLERNLRHDLPWPDWLPPLTVRQIYEVAESRYVPARVRECRVVLVRATEGKGADEPYRDLYADASLGWAARAPGVLEVIDVPGGHASMLQEPAVAALALELTRIVGTAPEAPARYADVESATGS